MNDLPDSKCNKARTLAFRDAVLLRLQELGVTGAHRVGLGSEPSSGGMTDSGAIDLSPFLLTSHRQQTMDLSGTQDRAELLAREHGRELWATVHHRRGHDIDHSYVTLPLSVLAALVGQLQTSALVMDDLTAYSLLTPSS